MAAKGRKTSFGKRVAGEICGRLVAGETLKSICRHPSMPRYRTVFAWIDRYPDFAEAYRRARCAAAEAIADEMLDIADGPGGRDGWGDTVQRDRLRIDARKWLVTRFQPDRPDAGITVQIVRLCDEDLGDDDAAETGSGDDGPAPG